MWCSELNSLVTSREITFDESPVLLDMSVYNSVYRYLNGVRFKVELEPNSSEIEVTSEIINMDSFVLRWR